MCEAQKTERTGDMVEWQREHLGSIPSSEEIKCQLTLCTMMLANQWERKSCNLQREGHRMQGLCD